jgi:hypothetical protein
MQTQDSLCIMVLIFVCIGGGDDEEGEVPKKKAREEDVPQKKRGNVFIDDQAERGSDDEDDEGDEDDESKEDRNEYVSDGFVVMDGAEGSDDDDDEGGDGEGRGKQEDNPLKKKKIRERLGRRTGQILDQDDLDLIEENARSAGERYKEAEVPRHAHATQNHYCACILYCI